MAAYSPDLRAQPSESAGSDIAGLGNFLIDPAGAAPKLNRKWFWITPWLLFSVVSLVVGYFMIPIVRHALESAPIPEGTPPEQYQKGLSVGLAIQKFFVYASPLTTAAIYAIEAALVLAGSAMLGVKAQFRQLYNLVAGTSIISLLGLIAGFLILKLKGDIQSPAELRPPMGLDIFLPEGTNKVLAATLGYFSVFEIWWIVMAVLIFSLAFRTSKGKAFGALSPLILGGLLLRIIGAIFSR